MNVPNVLSITRIALVPVFAGFYLQGRTGPALIVLLLCGISDVLDGAIARKYNMVSDLGKMLDPAADKIMQLAMLLCAAPAGRPLLWLLGLHVFKELSLGALALLSIQSSGCVKSSGWYGKLCSGALYAFLMYLLAFPQSPGLFVNLGAALCAGLMVFSFVMYGADHLRAIDRGSN